MAPRWRRTQEGVVSTRAFRKHWGVSSVMDYVFMVTSIQQEIWSCRYDPWVGKIPLEEEMATHSSVLPGKAHGQRSLEGYSP